jgi:DNA-binding CsgD family transcriptional regulator
MGGLVRRPQGLSKGCRTVLELAAFWGESFSLEVLGALGGHTEEEVLGLLAEGLWQRILLSDGSLFQFAHSLIRHVFYADPSAAQRTRTTPAGLNAMAAEVLLQTAEGRNAQEIAAALMLSPRTVARHLRSLRTRVGVSGRDDAAIYARERGLSSRIAPQQAGLTSAHTFQERGESAQPLLIVLITDMEGSTVLIDRLGDGPSRLRT